MPDTPADTAARLAQWRDRIDGHLATLLPDPATPPLRLHAAMRHAVLQGGKRMRPLLTYATGTAMGADQAALDAPAAAVELIHAYSLVHDDLPAMDDDTLRRGQPTVHVAFDEATAILAGDALQSLAFSVLAASPLDADVRVSMLAELAAAAGAGGMCGGQALDIDATGAGTDVDIDALHRLHSLKTGALLRASIRLGAIAARADAATLERLDGFANALGLAFQIRDDILDVEGNSATLGKTAGKDAAQAKATFPALMGMLAAQRRLQELSEAMRKALASSTGEADALLALAQHVVARDH